MKRIDQLLGWKIYFDEHGPVTGKYRAFRFGVSMGANTLEMLKNMIRNHHEEDQRNKIKVKE